MATRLADVAPASLIERLAAIVGAAHVTTDEAERRFLATDVFRAVHIPVAGVAPGTVEELQGVVRVAYEAGVPVVVRGGGASYTDGYTHAREGGITIDTRRLKAISVNEADNTVTVEPGVTWAELRAALLDKGLKTPFWGPFSGLNATIGGSMSQNSISHGPGVSAESVLCFDIITGTGELLRTGTAGHAQSNPFFRFFGPDLAGLFTGDCGALGVKARITLPLKRRNEAFAAASFDFSSFEALHGAFHALALEGLDEENFGLDQALQQGQIGRNDSVAAKAQMAGAVLKTSSSLASGVKQLAKMAIAGDKALKAASYAAHFIIEGVDGADAQAKQKVIQRIASQFGTEIPNSVPTVVRGMPFAPFTNVLGPKGERWLPMHALLAHSAVLGFHAAITDYWASQAEVMAKHGIFTGGMFMNVGSSAFVYEPTFYWPGAQHIYHQRTVPADHLAGLPTYPAAPDADQEVYRMKKDVVDLMHAHGAAHLQVGRSYPLMKGRNGPAADLLRAIKAALDPKGILNPGALGV